MTGLYNKKHGFLFVHVPKCGGTSMTNALGKVAGTVPFGEIPSIVTAMRVENETNPDVVRDVGHARAIDARKGLGEAEYDRLLSFGVVRNPWNVMRSRYHYSRRVFRQPDPAPWDGPFSDFAIWACLNHPARMCGRLADHGGKLIVNRVLRFESLADDFESLTIDLFGQALDLPRDNSSENRNDDAYSAEAIEQMRKTYADDFSLFDYPDVPE